LVFIVFLLSVFSCVLLVVFHFHDLLFLEHEHEIVIMLLFVLVVVLVVVLVLGSLSKHPRQERHFLEDELEYEDDYDYA